MLDVDVSGVLQPPGEEDVLHLKVEDLDESFIRFKEDSTVRELFASGRNLLEYIRSYELSIDELEEKSVLETIRNLDHVGILYHEITNCETIVNDLEEEIRGFRTSLTHAAQEMQSLRGRTLTTAQHSNNRRELSARLTDIQEKLHIPETLLESLAVDEINTDYMCYLRQLEQHMRYMNEYGLLDMAVTRNEVWPRVESAIANVSTRLQAHIAKRLGQLQDEGTNISIVQQAIATSCSFANYFVGEYSPQSYTSLCSEYRDVMGRVYLNHTRAYLKEQSKVQASNASRGVRVPAMILIGSSDVFDIHSGKEVSNKKYAITKLAAAAVKLSSVYLSKDSVELEVRDRLYSLRSITGIQGQMFADPSKREAGKAFHTWCDSLLLCFVRLANYMITEKQFELDFFRIPSIPKTSWQDILDGVFTKSTALLDDTLRKELDLNADDIEGMIILARGLDVVQCYFHRNADQANPTLARQLQAWNTCLKEHILALFARNLCSVRDILSCPMQPHRSTHFRNSIAEAVATNPLLEAQLNIHPIVLRYAQFSGPLYFLNTMPLQYSCLDTPIPQSDDGEESTLVREQSSNGSSSASVPPLTVETKCLRNSSSSLDRIGKSTVFEDFIAVSLNSLLQEMRKVITALSRRHTNNVLQLLFLIRNYSGLLHVWDRQESLANLPDYLEVRKALENVMREFVKYELEASAFGKVQEFYDKYNQNVSTPGSRAGGVVVETSQRTYETANAYEDASIVPFNGKPSENMSSVTLSSVAMQEMQTMVLLFHKSWQNTVSTAYETFGKYFGKESDVTIGMMILYFETACNINQKLREMVVAFAPNAPFRSKLVSTQGIRHEMSRYVPARYHAPNTT